MLAVVHKRQPVGTALVSQTWCSFSLATFVATDLDVVKVQRHQARAGSSNVPNKHPDSPRQRGFWAWLYTIVQLSNLVKTATFVIFFALFLCSKTPCLPSWSPETRMWSLVGDHLTATAAEPWPRNSWDVEPDLRSIRFTWLVPAMATRGEGDFRRCALDSFVIVNSSTGSRTFESHTWISHKPSFSQVIATVRSTIV